MNNKKNIARVGIIGATLLGLTGTAISTTPAVAEFTQPKTQTLSFQKPMNIVESMEISRSFKRIEAQVITTKPWLKPAVAKKQLSNKELISVLRSAGFEGGSLRMAWAVVMKESTRRPFAHNDNPSTGDNSYGLFQINMRGSMGPDRREKFGLESNEDLFDPITNAKIAFRMSSGGKNWSAWTTHKKAREIVNQFPG
jgi:hypothetical protein